MNEKGLSETIEKGEDTFTEFKEEKAHSDDLAAEIVAFANTEGGKILLGISDKVRRPFRAESAYCILSGKDGIYDSNWNGNCKNDLTPERAHG